MSEWDDRLANHEAVRWLGQVRATADDTGRRLTKDTRETLDRIRAVARHIQSLIDQADPQLVAPGMLDRLSSPLSQVAALLATFRSTGDLASLMSTNAYLDAALDAMGWPSIRTPRDAVKIRENVTTMRRSAGQLVRKLAEEVAEATAETKALGKEVAARKSLLKEATAEVKAELKAEVAPVRASLTSLQATINAQSGRLDTAIATFQEQFSSAEARRAELATAAESKRADASADTITKLQDRHADSLKKQAKTAADSFSKSEAAAGERLATLAKLEKEAQRLVSKTGSAAVSGGYVAQANVQGRAADIWRGIGVALVILVTIYGFLSVGISGSIVFDFHWLAGRLLVAIPLVGLALYAFSQSSKHRMRERDARQNELDFAALDPYIELLPDEQRHALKKELAGRAFFRSTAVAGESDADTISQLLAILKEAVKRT